MKPCKFLLPLFLGALLVISTLVVLNQGSEVAADVLRKWEGNWYWKDGGWTDYAPNGVPDFDQKQNGLMGPWQNAAGNWSYCGPVAVANSLWWFDSKFEPFPVAPSAINDNYYLVTSYGGWPPAWDDHDPQNVGGLGFAGLVDDLAWYFDTDGIRSKAPIFGTEVHTMSYGLQWYLYGKTPTTTWGVPSFLGPSPPFGYRNVSYYDDYHVQLVKMPIWEWVVEEVERSEDIILLLGFWQEQDGEWKRLGGHYVTVAGINASGPRIAFSDPYYDNAEAKGPTWGRVLSGTLFIPHQHPAFTPDPTHNDAGNISHDAYTVTLTATSPAGLWEIEDYPYVVPDDFEDQNVPVEFRGDQDDYAGGPVFVEVEYAIAMSPFYWKPGGEWVWLWYEDAWMWEWWWYEDDGDSCLPDFWWGLDMERYDGPVAVANSFWWFDSKAETLITGGWPKEPPTISDHYNLVGAYDPSFDDHAITNTVLLIDNLATNYLNTNPQGTTPLSMTTGIGDYLAARGVTSDFYTKTQKSPSFEWVADEVETSEDVILLLGFYEDIGAGTWERKGGHWVNAAGVNRESGLIGLSDSALDNAITPSISDTLYLGRVFPPEHLGTPFTIEEKQTPQNISHDIYAIVTGTIPGDHQWALADYPATSIIANFIGLNGGGTLWIGNPISTTVEWAIAVSPYSDLIITKTAVVTEVIAGDRITYTLEYANTGLAAADSVIITDMLALDELTDLAYTASPPLSATQGLTYVWTIPRLSYGQSGVVTITATSLVTKVLTNTAYITGLNAISAPTPDRNPGNNIGKFDIPKLQVTKQADPDPVKPGETLTYTIRITNTGNVDLQATVTDTLPAQVAPTGTFIWMPVVITANGGVWTKQVTVTVEMGYSGTLTNEARVTTDKDVTGVYTETSETRITPALTVTKQANPDPVPPGEILTYTIRVTNTGNVDLQVTITDNILPAAYVTPTSVFSWTSIVITAPGGVWTEQVTVTVETSYTGQLTNVVQVTTEEGATGVYTKTCTVGGGNIYLPIILKKS